MKTKKNKYYKNTNVTCNKLKGTRKNPAMIEFYIDGHGTIKWPIVSKQSPFVTQNVANI